jgi:hypothetical protein
MKLECFLAAPRGAEQKLLIRRALLLMLGYYFSIVIFQGLKKNSDTESQTILVASL